MGLDVVTKSGLKGRIDAPFGKSGKFKVVFSEEHHLEKNEEFVINFKRYVFDKEKKIIQDWSVCYTFLDLASK